jgi:DNA repair photolyase
MLRHKEAGTVLNRHKQRDSWFLDEYSVNPYEGCSCNCLYCYVAGSRYGENIEPGIGIKDNVESLLEKELAPKAKKNLYGYVAVGSATDAYMSHEEKFRKTEAVLKVLLKYRFPVFISTKSSLILRDIELLRQIDRQATLPFDLRQDPGRGAILSVSISTTDDKIAAMLEPAAALPSERFRIVSRLKEEGFLVGVNAIPTLPFISDSPEELEKTISAAKSSGADYILVGGLTLFGKDPSDSKTLYYKFLNKFNPSLIAKYDSLFGNNFYLPAGYHRNLKLMSDDLSRKYKIRTSILNHVETK